MKNKRKKVLLVGWDAADWDIINPLVDAGEMPGIASIINEGVMGNLATLEPPFSPMMWTSIATGKRPDKHGILGFVEPLPDGSGIRPVSSLSRKCKAIWNILMQNGYKSHVIGWWPSHPVEPINGVMVSNIFQKVENIAEKWKMPERSVHPNALHGLIEHLRVHPMELSEQHLHPFIHDLGSIDQTKDTRVATIANLIAESASIHMAATWAMENREWDFAAVYFDTIDHFCHGFMNFYPPKTKWANEKDYEHYNETIKSAYRFQDLMLQQLMKMVGPDTFVMVVSDHGFKSGRDRSPIIPNEPAGPAAHHRDHGIFCVKGPGIKKDERIYGACLLDITPTILSIFGLPIGRDMDGTPLVQAFQQKVEVDVVDSWEAIDGDCGQLIHDFEDNPIDSAAAIRQLVDLGYIDDPGADVKVDKYIDELQYNLARVHMGAGKYADAGVILESLMPKHGHEGRIALRLLDCLKETNEFDKAFKVLAEFREELKTKVKDKDDEKLLKENIAASKEELSRNHPLIMRMNKLKQAGRDSIISIISEAELLLASGKAQQCIDLIEKNRERLPKTTVILILLGKACMRLKDYQKALGFYESSVVHAPNNSQGYLGKSAALFMLKQYEAAAESAIDAVNLMYYNPLAHFYLGKALHKLKDYENAAMAMETCLRMNPGIVKARSVLIDIYSKHLIDENKLSAVKNIHIDSKADDVEDLTEMSDVVSLVNRIAASDKEPIYIVSGLPRSGTSLMMQMLNAGGMSLLTDQKRQADENNPKGYYELESVKGTATNKSWVKDASGKVVKVISHLLQHLPGNNNYKVIFMHRNIQEIIISQQKMTGKENQAYPLTLETNFKAHLAKIEHWFKRNPHFEVMHIQYTDLIKDPQNHAKVLADFIGKPLDIDKMCAAVDKTLYRNKNKEKDDIK